MLTISPSCGFTDNVTFSCAPITAISCAFNPATITLAGSAAGTTLTVSTLTSVSHYGLLMPGLVGPCVLLIAVVWFSLVMLAKTLNRSRLFGDCDSGFNDSRAGARDRWLRHCHRSIRSYFAHRYPQSQSVVTRKKARDRIIPVRGLDRWPILLVVLSLPFTISQVGTDSFAATVKASLLPKMWRRSPEPMGHCKCTI
jgi:hypothetical protein